jgi:hypothetical protein
MAISSITEQISNPLFNLKFPFLSSGSLEKLTVVGLNTDGRIFQVSNLRLSDLEKIIGIVTESTNIENTTIYTIFKGMIKTSEFEKFNLNDEIYVGNNGELVNVKPTNGFIKLIGKIIVEKTLLLFDNVTELQTTTNFFSFRYKLIGNNITEDIICKLKENDNIKSISFLILKPFEQGTIEIFLNEEKIIDKDSTDLNVREEFVNLFHRKIYKQTDLNLKTNNLSDDGELEIEIVYTM